MCLLYVNYYLATTEAVAVPPRLLRTVMFPGLVELLSSPRYCPPPLFDSVPISAPVEVTNTRSVAELLVLVASTRRIRLSDSYSARVIRTVSVAGGGGGGDVAELIVSDAERVMPFRLAEIVAVVVVLTVEVLTLNVADDAPAPTVTLAGTVADALLLASVTVVAAVAAALSVTVPWTAFPPVTEVGFKLIADNVTGAGGGGAPGVTVTVTSRRPSWLLRTRTVAR